MDVGKLLLTVPEAASKLELGRSLIYRLIMTGELESIKIGRSRRVPIQALYKFIEDRRSVTRDGEAEG